MAQFGCPVIKLRTDGEPAIKVVARKIAAALREGKAPGAEGVRVIVDEALRNMGAFQTLPRADVLTLCYAVEAEYNRTLHTSHNIWPWLVR